MITETYKKGMKIGWCVRPYLYDSKTIPSEWSDSVELAHLADYIKGEVNRVSVIKAIKIVKKLNNLPDRNWYDNVRGLVAGYYFGNPDKRNIKLAEKAEEIWDDDIEGNYGYYHDVCQEVNDGYYG